VEAVEVSVDESPTLFVHTNRTVFMHVIVW